jgi:DSF synthase
MNARVEFSFTSLFPQKYEQLDVKFDPELAVAWTYMNPIGAPYFNMGLLGELRAHDGAFETSGGRVPFDNQMCQAHYHVLASKIDGVYNLGGDLSRFVALIKSRNRDGLLEYATLCIDDISARINSYNTPVTTISLVQGEALGGGFETALSSSVIIAERRARMGLPEILFNLFPGMGAYSLLARRIGAKRAEDLILSGRIYTAAELMELGIVDVLAEDGRGEQAVHDFVRRNEKKRIGMQAVFSARQHVNPISYDELMRITTLWVDAAMRLPERDLKIMNRIARAQQRRLDRDAANSELEPAQAC